ncbi:hypothetical protein H8D91_01910 [archaeon]|nr:hypothetical protein [archaeon]
MAIKMAEGVNVTFKKACELAEIPATRRQWKKWQKGKGLARKFESLVKK